MVREQKAVPENFGGPKKNKNSFQLFQDSVRAKVMEEMKAAGHTAGRNGTLMGEVGRKMGAMWKDISAEDKKKWEDQAKADKTAYAKLQMEWEKTPQFKEYKETKRKQDTKKAGKVAAKAAKASGRPVKPMTSGKLYWMNQPAQAEKMKAQLAAEGKSGTLQNRMAIINPLWEAACAEPGWEDKLKQEMKDATAQYKVDYAEWLKTEGGLVFLADKKKQLRTGKTKSQIARMDKADLIEELQENNGYPKLAKGHSGGLALFKFEKNREEGGDEEEAEEGAESGSKSKQLKEAWLKLSEEERAQYTRRCEAAEKKHADEITAWNNDNKELCKKIRDAEKAVDRAVAYDKKKKAEQSDKLAAAAAGEEYEKPAKRRKVADGAAVAGGDEEQGSGGEEAEEAAGEEAAEDAAME